MNILFITTRYGRGLGGKENCLWKLAQEISGVHEVRVVARFDKGIDFWDSWKRFSSSQEQRSYLDGRVEVDIIRLNLFEKLWLFPVYKLHFYSVTREIAVWMFNKVFNRKLLPFMGWADIIHYDGTGMELIGYSGCSLAKRLSKPFIIVPHCHIGSWGDAPIDMGLYKKADVVIAKTKYEKKIMLSRGITKDIVVIGNAPILSPNCDAGQFKRKYNIKENMVLFIARKTRRKGYYALRDAAPIVLGEIPDTSFVFMGSGKSLPQSECIVEIGVADEFEKTSAFAACDVFCMPSSAEAFGIVFVEAWAMRKPVIGGDIPALREIIDDGRDGLLARQNPREIAEKILFLLKNERVRTEMGKRGKKKVEENYTWKKVVEKTEEIYRRTVGSKQ